MKPQPTSPHLLRLVAQLLPPRPGEAGPSRHASPPVPLDRLRRAVGPVLRGRGRSMERPREPATSTAERLRWVAGWMQAWDPALARGCPLPLGALLGWIEERMAPDEGALALRDSAGTAHPASWEARCRALAARADALGSPEGCRVAGMLRAWEELGRRARGTGRP